MTPVQRMERRKARELMRRVLAAAPGATGIVLGPSWRTTFAAMHHVANVAADEGRVLAVSLDGLRMVEFEGRRTIRASVAELRGRTLVAVWSLPGTPRELLEVAMASLALSRGSLIA